MYNFGKFIHNIYGDEFMKKTYPLYIFILSLLLLNIFLILGSIKSKNNLDEYFRLHVVANSNSVDDQIIKLNVVKKINNYLNTLYKSTNYSNSDLNEKDKAKILIEDNINNILEIANTELINQNANYICYANIGKISYEEKHSDEIYMNKGTYDSVQIVLGNGEGENFWSLIFPYSYNSNFDIQNNNYNTNEEIQIKSGILETIKEVVKTFKS